MIVCSKHARRYVEGNCAMQLRAAAELVQLQRTAMACAIVLVDPDDPDHVVVASIGLTEDVELGLAMAAEIPFRLL